MSAAELKSLVKALHGASTAEVRLITLPYGLPVTSVPFADFDFDVIRMLSGRVAAR